MNHQIGIHPADFSGVHIGDLQDVVVLWLPGTSSAMNDLPHLPVFVAGFTWQEVMPHAPCSWLHVQEQGAFSALLIDAVIDRQGQ